MAVLTANFFSECLMRTVTVNVILPVDKIPVTERRGKPFKTLYLLHGIFGNYADWINGTRIQAWAQEKNLAVVMPSGENRFYLDQEDTHELGGEFIGRELVRITRAMFHLSDKREDTFLAGLSMGGYGALRNGLKYYDTFGYVAGLSAALILDTIPSASEESSSIIGSKKYYRAVFGDIDKLTGSDKDYKALIDRLKETGGEIPKLYLACGTEDGLYAPNLDFKNYLEQKGVACTWEEGSGGHNWAFWDTYIHRVLDWLPLEEATESIHSGNVK